MNQPIQHMTYLYNYAGEPWKTQYWVRKVMDKLYTPNPDGYCGDEDNGQTSAWYVFSAMGFYPVCPGQDMYVFGSPIFDKVTVSLPNGNTLTIKSENNNKNNVYIQDLSFNGKQWDKNFIGHDDLLQGGTINFKMGGKPNTSRGISKESYPPSMSTEE